MGSYMHMYRRDILYISHSSVICNLHFIALRIIGFTITPTFCYTHSLYAMLSSPPLPGQPPVPDYPAVIIVSVQVVTL